MKKVRQYIRLSLRVLRQPLILILCIELGSSVQTVFRAVTDRSVQAILKADNLVKREYTPD